MQAHLLCTHIARFVSEAVLPGASLLPASVRGRMPVVLGGDFNSLPLKTISDAFDTGGPYEVEPSARNCD